MIVVCVMHAAFDPERRATLEALRQRVEPDHVEVDTTRRGAWDVARSCWLKGLRIAERTGATHVVVLNDDALPCVDFREVAEKALAARSLEDIVCFYTNHPRCPMIRPWYTTVNGLVGVGCAMSTLVVGEFLAWQGNVKSPTPPYLTDDGRINLFAMATERLIYTTVPSLVDHQLPASSLVGNAAHEHRRPIVPPLDDMRAVNWSAPSTHLGRMYLDSHWWLLTATVPYAWERFGLVNKVYRIERGA